MEPLDPPKNDENGGFSKRRISSILKAPRKSIRFPEPEQQENVVESVKPVEKRNSRRVSFAPANDVLLFSKDVKNASPVRSPLQELITPAPATQKWVEVAVAENGIQQIAGMETLLNAPLHASQQKLKGIGDDFGEKTVMFSTDDAFMDMTHSHTINIANDADVFADISLQNGDVLPTRGEKTVMFTADDGSMDMTSSHTMSMTSGSVFLSTDRNMEFGAEKRNKSSSVPSLDDGFKDFLASLSKPSAEEKSSSMAQIKTQKADADKENHAPTSKSAVREKSFSTSRKISGPSYGSALCTEDDVGMDMTEAQTGLIQGVADKDDDDPFQCLFPTQEMYSHRENTASQTAKTKQQQSSKTLPSHNTKDMTSLKNPTQQAPCQRQKVSSDTKEEHRDKTIMFTAGDEFMDMTQSHTVNIASGSFAPPKQNLDIFQTHGKMDKTSSVDRKRETCAPSGSSAGGLDLGFKDFLTSLSKTGNPVITPAAPSSRSLTESFVGGTICPENDVSMDMTEAQTGRIVGPSGSDDPFQFLFPTQDMYPHREGVRDAELTSGQKSSRGLGSSNRPGMETALKSNLKTKQRPQVRCDAEDDCRDKTVRFSADDACMDVTRSHTVNIATDLQLQSHQNLNFLPPCGEKTVRFSANDAAMDMTQCLTVNIASNFVSDSGFNDGLTSFSKQSGPNVNSGVARMMPTAAQSSAFGYSSNEGTICPEDDLSMDMTEAQTGRILGVTGADDCFFPAQDTYVQGHLKTAAMTSQQQPSKVLGSSNRAGIENSLTTSLKMKGQKHQIKFDAEDDCREKTVRFTADDAAMDVTRSHTVHIAASFEPQSHHNLDIMPTYGEKTVRFTVNDAAMDVTRSHTVNIATAFQPQLHQNVNSLPTSGEKTVKFTAHDAAMDETRSHTVNIAASFEPQSHQNVDVMPTCGEKTVRFTVNDAAMDVTRSHTVNIATAFQPQSNQNVNFLAASGEKTVKFTAHDAAMDVTRSHTVNIAASFEPQSEQNVDFMPPSGEKTPRFSANDAAMDMTQSLTVNIASNSVSGSVLPQQVSNIFSSQENADFPLSVRKRQSETYRSRKSRSSSAHALDLGFKNSLSKTSDPWANSVITKAVAPEASSPQEVVNPNGLLDQLKTQTADFESEKEYTGYVSAPLEKTVSPEDDVGMDMTEAQTGHILAQACTAEPPQNTSNTQDVNPNSDHLKKPEVTSQQRDEALRSSSADGVKFTNHPRSSISEETETRKEQEPRNQTCSPSAVDHDVDAVPTRKSRRMSLADLHSKVRRLSHMINTAPDTITLDSCTASLPQLEQEMDKNSKDKTKSLPVPESDLKMGLVDPEDSTQSPCLMQEDQPSGTTPFNLKTKLMSRLSLGNFKPKLPQRRKSDDSKKAKSVGDHTKTITVSVTSQLNNFDGEVSDIYDEELGSCEDMSEILDPRSPQRVSDEKTSPSQEFNMDESLEGDVFEQDFVSSVHGKKRPSPVDENDTEDEKRMKASTETATDFDVVLQSHAEECDGNVTTAPSMTTHTTDYSNNSHTASIRCEATFESTFKQSLFESQLEDYASDVQRKFDDGTITVLEFFKLFNIDFVIHNPRQSVLPSRLLSDTDCTPMDLLKDRHISRPKQTVYETNVLNLTEKVEGLKERMQDLDKPLRTVNRPLWEEMRNCSEKELKSFGAKLKERNNLFRKMSKVQSHEMKEALYSDLVQANLEEQQRLRGTIEEADKMIKTLDDCIHELETELTAVEEKGSADRPSLKSCQEEMQKVTEALAENDREMAELEMQKTQNSNKLNRLKAETRKLQSHIATLHTVNEWKFGEKKDDGTIYTFLHDTFYLQLLFEKSNGNDADDQSERTITHITFGLLLDDEESQDHACLVHKLLSQYIDEEAAWVEKYPTSRHVPKLLHDVGLVVSRCRLLGEELRLLKMWGGLRLDILNISCVDTQVHVVFSSLKKLSKFEVIFTVSLTNHLCVLQVQSFKNIIGSTTIQQIEEIVASFSPAKNLLTKIIRRIHKNLLS